MGRTRRARGAAVAGTRPSARRNQALAVAVEVRADRRGRKPQGVEARRGVREERLRRGAEAARRRDVAAGGTRPSDSPDRVAVDAGPALAVRPAADVADPGSDNRRAVGAALVGVLGAVQRARQVQGGTRAVAVQGDSWADPAAWQAGGRVEPRAAPVRRGRRMPAGNRSVRRVGSRHDPDSRAEVRRRGHQDDEACRAGREQDDEASRADRRPDHRVGPADGPLGARRTPVDDRAHRGADPPGDPRAARPRRGRRPGRPSSHVPTVRWGPGAGSGRRRGRADERNHRRPSCLLYPA